MHAREARLAQNETLFREINERVLSLAVRHGSDDHMYTFFCECSNADCTLQIELTLHSYEKVRVHGAHFVIAPGHELPEIEGVVEQNDSWWIVEKQDEAGELAENLDPRAAD